MKQACPNSFRFTFLTAAAVLLAGGQRADGRVADVTLAELVEYADAIGIVNVKRIETIRGVRVAVGQVERSFKGFSPEESVVFVAEPTWNCDLSYAVANDRCVLFLSDFPTQPFGSIRYPHHLRAGVAAKYGKQVRLFLITHSGRGYMPIHGLFRSYVQPSVELPSQLQAAEGSRKCRLSDLEAFVKGPDVSVDSRLLSTMSPETLYSAIWQDTDAAWEKKLEAVPILADRSEQVVGKLIQFAPLRRDEYKSYRWQRATQAIAYLGHPTVPSLLKIIEDNVSEMPVRTERQRMAIECLKQINSPSPDAIDALASFIADLDPSLTAPEIEAREEAASVLAQFGPSGRSGIAKLITALNLSAQLSEEWQTYRIRSSVVYAMSRIGAEDPEVIPIILNVLAADTSFYPFHAEDVSPYAILLASIGRDAVPALAEAAGDSNPNIRFIAAQALGQIGRDAQQAVLELTSLTEDENDQIRLQAIESLEQITSENPPAIPSSLQTAATVQVGPSSTIVWIVFFILSVSIWALVWFQFTRNISHRRDTVKQQAP